ncbi:GMC oxidoreductase [Sphingosinicella sp. BN140058]|uniref:GMC oxidoreductase n=1 Tax=Sphingosinicella sp. BN140058 TaxID=1892855 RepID=UPI001013B9A7|nr:GMC family oxidoreductase [Sphingosinicella sp. BN140058]QAY77553.1 GMC family oxidoreductase [Sphingosinicella sp. BN140058]
MFDAIVVGSGMSGGWAAKELTERGLKTLVLERGRHVEHGADYTDSLSPWELENFGMVPEEEAAEHYAVQSQCYAFSTATKHFWVKDTDHPYTTAEGRPFMWIRGYHLGGRSIMWARQSYRMSQIDFESNAKDGHGSDWPIRYDDMAPWYDHVEKFAGISGSRDGLEQLPDGQFLPPMAFTDAEKDFKAKLEKAYPTRKLIIGRCAHLTEAQPQHEELGRISCQYRSLCERGCSYGSYFSSLSATLPAAKNTGNLTIVTDAIVDSIVYDPKTGKASGVRVIDANTKERRTYEAKVVFLCASAIGTAQIMLNSQSEAFPNGIANRSDAVGRYLIDHLSGMGAGGTYQGFEAHYHRGRRPNGFYIPRYRNVTEEAEFSRGYGFQGGVLRDNWRRGVGQPGVGAELKQKLRSPGPWRIGLSGFGEMLPRPDNRVTLHKTRKDKWGIPLVHIDCSLGDNDRKMIEQVGQDAKEMLEMAGCTDIQVRKHYGGAGLGIHEMGTAHMGKEPTKSVLNKYNQAHDVPNLFVTDGACMASGGCQNPSLTYMAMSARGAHHAAAFLKEGKI